MSKTAKGKDLIFISRIKADGSGVEKLGNDPISQHWEDQTTFRLQSLSITCGTWIASANLSYVVKLKKNQNG